MPVLANAYIGPGMGLGAIGATFAFLAAIFFSFFAIIWYPLKRLFKQTKESDEDDSKIDAEETDS